MLSNLRLTLVSTLALLLRPNAILYILTAIALLFVGSSAAVAATNITTTTLIFYANGAQTYAVLPHTAVTLTASVTAAGSPLASGQVVFCDAIGPHCTDIHLLGTAQITPAGTATLRFIPGPGIHTYQAVFVGTHSYLGSSSVPIGLSVGTGGNTAITGLTYTGSPGDYTLTYTIANSANVPPTGTVSFLDTDNANYVLATAPIVGSSGFSLTTGTVNPTGDMPNNLVTADFNGDGILDIAVPAFNSLGAYVPGSVSIFLGNGDGTFTAAPSIPTGIFPSFVATADFNGDGKPDLAVTCLQTSTITIFLGNGDGTFTALAPIHEPFSDIGALAVGDLNGDGIEDIAMTQPGARTVLILLGNGDGTFTPVAQQPATGYNPVNIAIGDFNYDGNLDLAIDNIFAPDGSLAPTSLTILLGNGDGTFTAAPNVPVGVGPEGLVTADFNGDGKLDLAVANIQPPNANVAILLGNGDGTFNSPVSTIPIPYLNTLAIGDVNGDGIADIVTTEEVGQTAPQNVTTLLGKGDGTFNTLLAGDGSIVPVFGVAGDFNGDGLDDVAVSAEYGGVTIFLSTAGGSSTATVTNISPVGTGIHYIDASYPGDGVYASDLSNTVPLVAERVPTTLTLTNSASAAPGQAVTLTATLAPDLAQNHNATGAVTFSSNGIVLGTGTITNGIAILTTAALPAGVDTLSAAYPGDTNFAPSSTTDNSTGFPTTTNLTCNPSTLSVNTDSLFSATVTSANGTPTGSITFSDNGTLLSQPTLTNGAATYNFPARQSGAQTIVATYVPTGSFAASSASCVLTVNGVATTATLTVVPTVAAAGAPVTLTATVSAASSSRGAPSGTITFYNGSTVIDSGARLASGAVSFITTTLPPGIDNLTCTYSGPSTFAPSTCNIVPVTITATSAAITLTSSLNPAPFLTPITFTAQVAAGSGGTIVFNVNGQNITTTPNASGTATYTASTLPIGSYLITATWFATPNALAAQASLEQVVNAPVAAPDFSLTGTDTTFKINHTGTGKLVLASLGTFNGTVTLTCDPPLPKGYACTLQHSNVTLPLGFSTVITYTLSPTYSASNQPLRRSTRIILASLFPLSFFSLIGLVRKRRTPLSALLTLILLAILTTATTACGPDHFIPITIGTFPVTFTGTGTSQGDSTPIIHTLTVNATITP